MTILVLADHDLGALSPATARVVAAASVLGEIDVLVLGEGIDQVAADAAKLSGVARVLVAQHPGLVGQTAETFVPVLAKLAPDYAHIIASAGALGRDIVPRLAARLDIQPITDVIAIHGPNRFDRPIYAGNAIQTVSSAQPRQILTIRASAFRAAGQGGSAQIIPLDYDPVNAIATIVAAHRTENNTPDLATAQIVVGGGVSVGSAEGFKLVGQLAAIIGAGVGATRAAVDAGYAPNDWQIGQTGKIIAPDLYIAVGISGALQHLAGIQGAKKIIAINTDPEAPLVKLADIVLIGDLFETIPALIAQLEHLGVKP
ncbi:electron transfer flavoprotein subunit alpha/FixB family protein [Devosia rhodophyticola]|uniref:Electron transfer flavoprotein subunit alpha/FixB family protein n=1 Tax=Devosia rhodophyticola TaxID=3026423 RepID=A0ABY7YZ30_9HYPH|nr:electron transfer flavoprotein subunit alpha/FixB family protein [Devosia rhodophyticola]WDR06648.1 electron transfer flavoprotein subunit alpha/FixB family protein [Devosia rhodophyticola]